MINSDIKHNREIKNIVSSLILYVVTILQGFILPKLLLENFGSTVNGLTSSIYQFLSFIELFEGGAAGVIVANLYSSIGKKDLYTTKKIFNSSRKIFNVIGTIYFILALIIGVFYPLVFKTNFSFIYVFSLTIILSLSMLLQYIMCISYRLLLNADRRVDIVSNITSCMMILNVALAAISLKIYPSIHFFKLTAFLAYIIQPFLFKHFIDKELLSYDTDEVDTKTYSERWNGLGNNVAAFVNGSVDIVVLTVFSTLEIVSVYAVFLMVLKACRKFIEAIIDALTPMLGQDYSTKDNKYLNDKFDEVEVIITFLSNIVFSCCFVMLNSFVLLYTKNIIDIDYNRPIFAIILSLATYFMCFRLPYHNMVKAANHFIETQKYAFIETGLNIVVSVALVFKFGLVGVAIGTVISALYRIVMTNYYLSKYILNRSFFKFIKNFLISLVLLFVSYIICIKSVGIETNSFIQWIFKTILVTIIILMLNFVVYIAFYNKPLKAIRSYLCKNLKH